MTGPRQVAELWHRLDVSVRDLPVGLFLLIGSLVPALQRQGTELGGVAPRAFDAVALFAVVLQSLPLAGRRRWPLACLAVIALGFAVDQLRGYHTLAGTGLVIAVLSAGAHVQRGRRTTVLVFSLAYVPLAITLFRIGSEPPSEFVTFYLALALAWGIGAWLRAGRRADAERRRRVAEETRTAERTRIARELHDVVTHHVTAMVVQAEAAKYLTAAPERLDEALTAVTDTGRRAIGDLRHLLDLLNPDHTTEGETPPVGRFHALVEQTRLTGQPIDFTERGTPSPSSGGTDPVAYRVVQEALTNALKYAHGSRTSVRVLHGEKETTVEVGTDGSGTEAPLAEGSGRGLAGLRERVGVLGGAFDAGPQTDGGFRVWARIPTGGSV